MADDKTENQKPSSNVTPITGKPEYRPDDVQDFIETYFPEPPYYVNRIEAPKGASMAKQYNTITTLNRDMADYNSSANKTFNVYFSPARVNPTVNKKANKDDIVEVGYLWADIDPKKDIENRDAARAALLKSLTSDLPDGVPKPTLILDSGNGYWGLWKLREPVVLSAPGTDDRARQVAEIEAANNWLANLAWGGDRADACHNIDRVARMPGTINWPTARKLKAGYVPQQAMLIRAHSDVERVYDLDDFGRLAVEPSKPKAGYVAGAADVEAVTLDEIETRTNHATRELVEFGKRADDKEVDRSKYVWMVLKKLAKAEFSDAQLRYIMLNDGWEIAAHNFDAHRDVLKYVNRQIANARASVVSDSEQFKVVPKTSVPIADSAGNVRLALHKLGLFPKYDRFTQSLTIDGGEVIWGDNRLTERSLSLLAGGMGLKFSLEAKETKIRQVLYAESAKRTYDSLIDLMDGLPEWDGTPRMDAVFVTYAHVEDTDLHREFGRCFLLGAVARAYDDRAYAFQGMPVLEGKQGLGKSSFFKSMSLRPDLHNDSLKLGADPKEVIEQTRGKLLVEFAELDGIKRNEVEAVKAMLSRDKDIARAAYGREAETVFRRFTLAGSVNPEHYLKDPTGARRFWPMRVVDDCSIDIGQLEKDVEQIWSEAVVRYKGGEDWRFSPKLYEAQAIEAAKRQVPDIDVAKVQDEFGLPDDPGAINGRIASSDVYNLIIDRKGFVDGNREAKIKKAMQDIGFTFHERLRVEPSKPRVRAFSRGSDAEREVLIKVRLNHSGQIIGVEGEAM